MKQGTWLFVGLGWLLATASMFLHLLAESSVRTVIPLLIALAFPGVATLLIRQRPGNPIGWLLFSFGLGVPFSILANEYGAYYLPALAAIFAVVWRYRRATGAERQQLKWFIAGAGASILILVTSFTFSFMALVPNEVVIATNAAATLAAFAAMARDEVELNTLTAGLIRVVSETVQPAHVSLWLMEKQ